MSDSNIAFSGSIYSYSSQQTGYEATKLISYYGEYRSTTGSNEWVIIDLHKQYPISGFKVHSGMSNFVDISVKDYHIGVSNTPNNFVTVISGRVPRPTINALGKVNPTEDESVVAINARYIKIYFDNNWSWGTEEEIASSEFEIYSPVVQQETTTVTSNAEIYYLNNTESITSDAYIVPKPILTETVQINSDATITDTRADILSDATIVYGKNVYSDAHIKKLETIDIQSDAMIYRSGSAVRAAFTMGKGSFEGFPDSGSTLIYCTDISTSDEVIVADIITSSIMDITDIVPPLGYQNYNWKYDWVVRTHNNAQYKFEIRTGETKQNLLASTFSPINLGQIIPIGEVPKYYQWQCHVWASGSGDFELHQFSIKGYIEYPANILYSSLNKGEFTTVSRIETGVDKLYEPMDMDRL